MNQLDIPSPPHPVSPASVPSRPAPKPWVALVLGQLCPGLGLMYVGRLRAGIVLAWLPACILVPVLIGVLRADGDLFNFSLWAIGISSVFFMAQLLQGIAGARRWPKDQPFKGYQRPRAYVGYIVATVVLGQLVSVALRTWVVEAFDISSQSMLPNLKPGEHFFVAKLGSRNQNPQPGELIVFRSPESHEIFVKRLIAQGGDEVLIRGGIVSVNGQEWPQQPVDARSFGTAKSDPPETLQGIVRRESHGDQSHTILLSREPTDPLQDPFGNTGPTKVPMGHFFVLGDHRDGSVDSRNFGSVPMDSYLGRVAEIFWSKGPQGIRWNRKARRAFAGIEWEPGPRLNFQDRRIDRTLSTN